MRTATDVEFDLVVPVEQTGGLERAVAELHDTLRRTMDTTWRITLADLTAVGPDAERLDRIASRLDGVRVVRLETPGRGHATKVAWLLSEARILSVFTVDGAISASEVCPATAGLRHDDVDVLVGIVDGPDGAAEETVIGLRREVARRVLPEAVDGGWFFDVELRVLAERAGLRVGRVHLSPAHAA